jgi:hypothetical protein
MFERPFATYMTKYVPKSIDGNLYYQINLRAVVEGDLQDLLNDIDKNMTPRRAKHLFDAPIDWDNIMMKNLGYRMEVNINRYKSFEFEATLSQIKVSNKYKTNGSRVFTYDFTLLKECDDGDTDALIMINFLDLKEEDENGKKVAVPIPTEFKPLD